MVQRCHLEYTPQTIIGCEVKIMFYVQCELVSGTSFDLRWIPEKLAQIGKSIIVKETGVEWVVKKTYGKAHEKQVIEMRDSHKHHRKATDV